MFIIEYIEIILYIYKFKKINSYNKLKVEQQKTQLSAEDQELEKAIKLSMLEYE